LVLVKFFIFLLSAASASVSLLNERWRGFAAAGLSLQAFTIFGKGGAN
jgi:hypothetical protein